MRRSSGVLLILGASGVLLAVLAVVLAMALQSDPQEVRGLADPGRMVGVTFGSEPLITGNHLQKALLGTFPFLDERIGGDCIPPPVGAAQRVVPWENTGAKGEFMDGNLGGVVTIVGDDGIPFRSRAFPLSLTVSGGNVYLPLEVRTYPRRSRVLRIRFEGSQGEPEWVVANPAPDQRPDWAPGPSTQRCRRVAATFSHAHTDGLGYVDFDLKIREDEKPAESAWQAEQVTVSDPTGNVEQDHSPLSTPGPSGLHIHAAAQLPAGEPVYRIRVTLARVNRYPPEEVWDFGEIETPPAGKLVRTKRRGELHGLPLSLFEIAGAGAAASNGGCAPRAVSVGVTGDYARFCPRAILGSEQNDRPFPFRNGLYCWSSTGLKAGQRYRARFVLSPKRTVEFLAPIPTAR